MKFKKGDLVSYYTGDYRGIIVDIVPNYGYAVCWSFPSTAVTGIPDFNPEYVLFLYKNPNDILKSIL